MLDLYILWSRSPSCHLGISRENILRNLTFQLLNTKLNTMHQFGYFKIYCIHSVKKKQQKRPLQKMHFLQCNSLYQRISITKFPQLPFSLSSITFPDYVVLHILSQFMLCLAKKHCLSFSSSNLGCLSVNISVLYRAVTDHSLTVIYFKPC